MKTKLNLMAMTTILLGCTLLLSFTVPQDKTSKPWDIPADYLKMTNPLEAGDKDMMKVGKMLYSKHCKSCLAISFRSWPCCETGKGGF